MKQNFPRAIIICSMFLVASAVHAQWTEPTLAPPNGNVSAPLRLNPDLNIGGAAFLQNNSRGLFSYNASGGLEQWMWPRWSDNAMYTNFGSSGWNIRNNSSVPVMFLTNAGNVGIGTTNPSYKLDVVGDLNVSGCLRVAGSCFTGGGVSGSGTTNYLSKWTAGTTLGNSQVFDNGTNVGIGTAGPNDKLDVQGNVIFGSGTYNSGAIVDIGNAGVDYPGNSGWAGSWNSNILLSGLNSTSISFHDAGTRVDTLRVGGGIFYLGENVGWGVANVSMPGSVGIGLANPAYKLHVVGDILADGGWLRTGDNNGWYNDTWGGGLHMSDPTWIRTYNDKSIWTGNGVIGTNNCLTVGYGGNFCGGASAIIAGNVGIGTQSPTNKLNIYASPTERIPYGLEVINNNDGALGGVIGAIRAETAVSNAVYAYAPNVGNGTGVFASGGWRGVNGYSAQGIGVRGESFTGTGVYGYTSSASVYGVQCFAANVSGLCGGNKAWTNTSDVRLKKNIETISSGLDKVLKLRGVTFNWKTDEKNEKTNIGFIAQEVLPVVPEVVNKDQDGYYTINESSITALLVESVKELKAENDALKARIEKLEEKVK